MIRHNGVHSVEKFVEIALYDKDFGYYTRNNPFGKRGDFITAPLISPLFSEMISIWIISFWIKLGKPKKFSFVELGPGNGEFCKTLCRTLGNFPELRNSIKIYLLEKSKKLIKVQKKSINNKNIIWIENLDQIKHGPVLFFGNEFFDSIPIKQFKVNKSKVFEKFLHFEKGRFKKFVFKRTTKKIYNELKDLKLLKKKGIVEYPKTGLKILDKIIKKIKKFKGGILLIDYGYTKAFGKDTLQSLRSHKKNIYYKNIGKSDITSLVNFELLNKFLTRKRLLSKIVKQGFFLKRLGILERAEILSKELNFREKADLYYRLERLLSEKKMGELFKVLFAECKNTRFDLGFK